MLKIGITGGMGSGKTTVCKVFETLGIAVYYADDKARQLMNENREVRNSIKAFFGDDIYGSNNMLDRAKLAQKVFINASLLKQLETIVHPAVANDFEQWANTHKNALMPYIVKEAALLFESGSYRQLDKNILVLASLEDRIERIIKRDATTREMALQRIAKQWPDEQKEPLADYILINNKDTLLLPQILKLHRLFSAGSLG